uniref:E4 protein n=1 Tax=Human papillomavirus TaxID=10566 RepID=A0A385PMX0_9PAPI|nr:MAG: E4 protein [Human papillomavirus]
MVCILKNTQEMQYISLYFFLMQKDMDKQEIGLYSIKMKLFLPLLPVPAPGSFPSLQGRSLDPPRTPHPLRKHLESVNGKPTKTPVGNRPPRPNLDFDYGAEEGGNKENIPPEQPEEDEEISILLPLLKKWALDLERLREKVLRDLDDCYRRLGIPH